jgi:hypothetical protein
MMLLTFEQIPEAGQSLPGATATTALKDLPVPLARRRAVLRGVVLGAMTVGAAALDWTGVFGSRAARAETAPYGMLGWDRNDCSDAYPAGYGEAPDTAGAFAGAPAACFGGQIRSSTLCSSAGWFKKGTFKEGKTGEWTVTYTPYNGACAGRHSWRWTTPDGLAYRCADGHKAVSLFDGPPTIYFGICRARV